MAPCPLSGRQRENSGSDADIVKPSKATSAESLAAGMIPLTTGLD
jgi:hypothetical protein